MTNTFDEITELLQEKAELQARLKLLPYQGTPEVKEVNGGRYLYVRERIAGRLTSKYVDKYSDDLYEALLRNSRESRELKKRIRQIDKELIQLGYEHKELSNEILVNIDFAKRSMKESIYDQAQLEGISTTFPQTETIIENGKVSGVSTEDIRKIINLKHAWEFILDEDVIQNKSDYFMVCYISKLVNEGFFSTAGKIRNVPVHIGGSSYVPPLPIETVVKENIDEILDKNVSDIDKAIDLCLYTMKTQIFIDGNKRTAVIFANHYLISHGQGIMIIPSEDTTQFKQLLVEYYEGEDAINIRTFLKEKCWRGMN